MPGSQAALAAHDYVRGSAELGLPGQKLLLVPLPSAFFFSLPTPGGGGAQWRREGLQVYSPLPQAASFASFDRSAKPFRASLARQAKDCLEKEINSPVTHSTRVHTHTLRSRLLSPIPIMQPRPLANCSKETTLPHGERLIKTSLSRSRKKRK
jgi:hypothetical protein